MTESQKPTDTVEYLNKGEIENAYKKTAEIESNFSNMLDKIENIKKSNPDQKTYEALKKQFPKDIDTYEKINAVKLMYEEMLLLSQQLKKDEKEGKFNWTSKTYENNESSINKKSIEQIPLNQKIPPIEEETNKIVDVMKKSGEQNYDKYNALLDRYYHHRNTIDKLHKELIEIKNKGTLAVENKINSEIINNSPDILDIQKSDPKDEPPVSYNFAETSYLKNIPPDQLSVAVKMLIDLGKIKGNIDFDNNIKSNPNPIIDNKDGKIFINMYPDKINKLELNYLENINIAKGDTNTEFYEANLKLRHNITSRFTNPSGGNFDWNSEVLRIFNESKIVVKNLDKLKADDLTVSVADNGEIRIKRKGYTSTSTETTSSGSTSESKTETKTDNTTDKAVESSFDTSEYKTSLNGFKLSDKITINITENPKGIKHNGFTPDNDPELKKADFMKKGGEIIHWGDHTDYTILVEKSTGKVVGLRDKNNTYYWLRTPPEAKTIIFKPGDEAFARFKEVDKSEEKENKLRKDLKDKLLKDKLMTENDSLYFAINSASKEITLRIIPKMELVKNKSEEEKKKEAEKKTGKKDDAKKDNKKESADTKKTDKDTQLVEQAKKAGEKVNATATKENADAKKTETSKDKATEASLNTDVVANIFKRNRKLQDIQNLINEKRFQTKDNLLSIYKYLKDNGNNLNSSDFPETEKRNEKIKLILGIIRNKIEPLIRDSEINNFTKANVLAFDKTSFDTIKKSLDKCNDLLNKIKGISFKNLLPDLIKNDFEGKDMETYEKDFRTQLLNHYKNKVTEITRQSINEANNFAYQNQRDEITKKANQVNNDLMTKLS